MSLHTILIWLLFAAFAGAGAFNAIGMQGTRNDFVRWGYPAWWCRVTGGLEIAIALLIAVPTTHRMGLLFGAVIVTAAVATVLKARDFSHLVPLTLFAALLAGASATLS